MTKRFQRILAITLLSTILLIGANAYSFSVTNVYLPLVYKNFGFAPSPSPSTPTPTATAPSPPQNTGLVEIKDIFYLGSGPDEYVVIENEESFPIQLQNWTLRDITNHVFTFPNFVIQPNQQCRVYTNQIHPDWCGFSYGSGSPIWNNDHDTAYLRDSNGTLIDDYSY